MIGCPVISMHDAHECSYYLLGTFLGTISAGPFPAPSQTSKIQITHPNKYSEPDSREGCKKRRGNIHVPINIENSPSSPSAGRIRVVGSWIYHLQKHLVSVSSSFKRESSPSTQPFQPCRAAPEANFLRAIERQGHLGFARSPRQKG
jgi:hypothetical protein